jgi:uncharacterized membrane protein
VLLVLPRCHQRALEAELVAVGTAAIAEQALDRGEVEAVRLHLRDQLDPGDVVRAVVAGAALDLGRLQEAARLVRADVAHRHPGLARELVDRHLRGRLVVRDHAHILRCFM